MEIKARHGRTTSGKDIFIPLDDSVEGNEYWILDDETYRDYLSYQQTLIEKARELKGVQKRERELAEITQTKQNIIELCRERANKERKIKNKKEDPGYIVLSSRLINYRCLNKETAEMWKTTVQTPFFVEISREDFFEYFIEDEYGKEFFKNIGIGSYKEIPIKSKREIVDNAGEYYIEIGLHKNFKSGFWEVDLIHYCEVTL